MVAIEKLLFSYTDAKQLFCDLDIKILPGNICGLLGENGAGKTTLLKIISGLLFPQSGNCNIFGFNPKERKAQFLGDIYFLPEEFYIPTITIPEYIKLYAPFYKKFDEKYFLNCVDEFQLSKIKKLSEHSYGQKKKFLLAFALASNCRLIMLDEPTNGLDIPSKTQFRKLLAQSITDEKTFVISTHQVRDVENLIDPIIVLHDGKIIFNESVATITKRLNFSIQPRIQKSSDVIYSEKSFSGYSVVSENKGAYESELDIEMLFKAILTNQKRIGEIFKGEVYAK